MDASAPAGGRTRMLVVSVHPPGRVPNLRFRVEQYEEFLRAHGFDIAYSPIYRDEEYSVIYRPGGVKKKALIAARGAAKRTRDLIAARRYDIVLVQREAIHLGTAAFEIALSRSPARVIFDFDDAIWIRHISRANERLAWLKRPAKTAKIIEASDMVFAGNAFLAAYARRFNENVKVVPTTIDTARYRLKRPRTDRSPVCVGWSGSFSTLEHFELALPALRELRDRFGDSVRFKVIGDGGYRNDELGIREVPWSAATEIAELADIDVGIMPMPDGDWSRGKCGLKGLLYMALETPSVMSPVGVNPEIIDHGRNGYLASSKEEWVGRLSELIESRSLRGRIGEAARATVVERYSVESEKDKLLAHLRELVGGAGSLDGG